MFKVRFQRNLNPFAKLLISNALGSALQNLLFWVAKLTVSARKTIGFGVQNNRFRNTA